MNSGEPAISIAHMRSPGGWQEPGQTPEFDEYTVVLRGMLRVEHRDGALEIRAGQAVILRRGEWVRYSTPEAGWRRVHRGLPAGIFPGDGSSRRLNAAGAAASALMDRVRNS